MIQQKQNAAFLSAIWIGGLFAVFFLPRSPSEPKSAVLFGYSLIRLAIAFLTLAAVAALIVFTTAEVRQPAWWKKVCARVGAFLSAQTNRFIVIAVLFTVFLALAAVLILAVSPAARELVLLNTVLKHLGVLIVWVEAAIVIIFLWLLAAGASAGRLEITPLRLAILFLILTVIYAAGLRAFMTLTWDTRMRGMEGIIFLPALVGLVWGLLNQHYRARAWYPTAARVLLITMIGVATFTAYRHMGQWMDWTFTPSKAYWNDLAYAFLNGRLYIEPPGTDHDLTFFNGRWYVPNPPLPAFILMPFVALAGSSEINTVLFSTIVGAINAVLVFLILEKAAALGLIPTRKTGNLLLTSLFAFGTSHWWLSMMGRMWFISQILTITFAALAALLVLYKRSPWLVGLCLGLAVLSRPNVFTLWPFLAGMMIYTQYRTTWKEEIKRIALWAVQSAVPVILAVAGLLYYNYIRFGDFLDFGYVTINSSDWLMSAVQTYGMFHPHFVPINLHLMFLKLPIIEMRGSCFYYSPTREGISMFAMTPALLFLFRRIRINWWTAGAWVSVILSIGLLMFYHNTGAWQMGYRYLMDFILPVLLLLAVGVGDRENWPFRLLVALSLLLTGAGIIWWFERWFC